MLPVPPGRADPAPVPSLPWRPVDPSQGEEATQERNHLLRKNPSLPIQIQTHSWYSKQPHLPNPGYVEVLGLLLGFPTPWSPEKESSPTFRMEEDGLGRGRGEPELQEVF